jgi:hypothetical protein
MFGFQRIPVFREAGFGEFHCISVWPFVIQISKEEGILQILLTASTPPHVYKPMSVVRIRSRRDHMIIGFKTTNAISAVHH